MGQTSRICKGLTAVALFALTSVSQASTLPATISEWTGSPFTVGDVTFTLLSTNITDSTSIGGATPASPGDIGFTINTSFLTAATLTFQADLDPSSGLTFDTASILSTSPCLANDSWCFEGSLTSADLAAPLSFDTRAPIGTVSDTGAITSGLQSVVFTFDTDNPGFRSNATEITVSTVPVPAAVWLFGSALAGLGWIRRKHTA